MIRYDSDRDVYTVDVSSHLMPELASGWSQPVRVCISSGTHPVGFEPGQLLPDDAVLTFRLAEPPAGETRWWAYIGPERLREVTVELVVESTDPDVIEAIERAAKRHDVELTNRRP